MPTTEEMLSAWGNESNKPKKKRIPKKSPYELAYEADLKFIAMYESNPSNYDSYCYRLAKIDVKRYKLERGLLTDKEKKELQKRLDLVSGKDGINNYTKTLKKYKDRKSPSVSANKNCGKIMKGNDGNMYESTSNKNNICTWKKLSTSKK